MRVSQTEFHLADESVTARLGAALAQAIRSHADAIATRGLVIGMSGDLGAGKTSLVRAMLRSLGVTGPVKSPTFALVEPYTISRLDFYHFDFYRFSDPNEFAAAGFREMFGPGSICAIEWIERAAGVPAPDLALTLTVEAQGRSLAACAQSELGVECLNEAVHHFRTDAAAG
jgi:tRNA threonylcarbamoyladenosine biosynthesis protein TsaE